MFFHHFLEFFRKLIIDSAMHKNTIDVVTTNEQYMSTKSTVEEKIVDNKIDLLFSISQTEKIFVKIFLVK